MVRALSDLLQELQQQSSRFQKDISTVDLSVLKHSLQGGETNENPVYFFGQGIMRLNAHFDCKATNSSSASCENGNEAISPDDPEAALFIRNLHSAHAAESMMHGSFRNAKVRLDTLTEAMETQAKWAESTEHALGKINSSLRDKICQKELLEATEKVAGLAEEWRVMIQGFIRKNK